MYAISLLLNVPQTIRVYFSCTQRGDSSHLVAARTGSGLSLSPQAQKNFFHPRQICRARPAPRNRLALRVLQVDELGHACPRRSLCQLSRSILEEFSLAFPVERTGCVSVSRHPAKTSFRR